MLSRTDPWPNCKAKFLVPERFHRSVHESCAKEFVAARDDESGVLILSSFAGASRELSESIIVSPYDCSAVGEAILQALQM